MMSIDFLIGAIRASRDLHPQVKTELEEIMHRAEPVKPDYETRSHPFHIGIEYMCGACRHPLEKGMSNYCQECGKPVDWT